MNAHRGVLRVGRLAKWQRRWSHAVLLLCALTGLVWFALLDGAGWSPSRLTFWWIGHGITSLAALVLIGAALPHHVPAAWRHHRNRVLGAAALAILGLAACSALLLMYGPEEWHAIAHGVHVAIGIAAAVLFPWHVLKGRRSVGRRTH